MIVELDTKEDNQANVEPSDPSSRKTSQSAVDISYNDTSTARQEKPLNVRSGSLGEFALQVIGGAMFPTEPGWGDRSCERSVYDRKSICSSAVENHFAVHHFARTLRFCL